MRVCSICGERNEDWMEICQRCGNSIVNASKVEYKAARKSPPVVVNDINTNTSINQTVKEKKPMVNMDLKLTLAVLLIILIILIAYTIYVIS